MTAILKNTNTGKEREFETIPEAKEQRQKLIEIGAEPGNLEIQENGTADAQGDTNNSEGDTTPEVVDADTDAREELPDEPPVGTDPLVWIPNEFQDEIDGTIAINRKGFEVLAHHYNVSCETELVERAEEIVIHKATATTQDGVVYTAFGESHSSQDSDHQLVRLSDTRAFKRAVSRATGIGMVAVEELKQEL